MSAHQRPPIDGDPLAAIGAELVAAAGRRRATGRRRSRALTIAAATIGLLTLTSGALALTNTGTGVPAVDSFLDASNEKVSDPSLPAHGALPPGAVSAPKQTLDPPEAGTASTPVPVVLGNGEHALGVGYQNTAGQLCGALASTDQPRQKPLAGTGVCLASVIVNDALLTEPARIAGAGTDVTIGFARPNVHSITATLPGGHRTEAALSNPWTPGAGGPIRIFFVVLSADSMPANSPPGSVRFEAQLSDGRTIPLNP